MPRNEGARIFRVLFVISRYCTSQTSSGCTNVAPFTAASPASSIGGSGRTSGSSWAMRSSSMRSVKPEPT
jgi:hypothetical protein